MAMLAERVESNGLSLARHPLSNGCLAALLMARGEWLRLLSAGDLMGRMKAMTTLASLLLTEDERGDPVVFAKGCGRLNYGEVLQAYLGDADAQAKRAKVIEELVGKLALNSERAGAIHEAIADWTEGDAGMVTLLLNGGDERVLPDGVRQRLYRLGVLSEKRRVNLFVGEEAILAYRYWQSHLCSRALLMTYYKGDDVQAERVLPLVRASMSTLQVATDLYHCKNPTEPTYARWWEYLRREGVALSRRQIVFEEAGVNFAGVGKLQERVMSGVAAMALLGLCRLMGDTAEWGK